MKKFKLAWLIFKQQKAFNVLIIFELALMLVMASIILNRLYYQNKNEIILEQSQMTNAVNFTAYGISSYALDKQKNYRIVLPQVKEILKEEPFVEGVSQMTLIGATTSENQIVTLLTYDQLTRSKLKIPLLAGKWLPIEQQTQTTNTEIPVVAVFNGQPTYKVNDNVEMAYKDKHYTLKIIGISDVVTGAVFFPDGSRNYLGDTSKLFQNIQQNSMIFLMPFFEEFNKTNPYEENIMIYFKKDTPESVIKTIQQKLAPLGQADKVGDMINKSKKISQTTKAKDESILLVITSAALIGLFSISILNINKQLRRFSIWQMQGYQLKQIGAVYCLYMFIIELFSMIMYIGLMKLGYLLDGRGHYYFYHLKMDNLLLSISVISLVLAIVTEIALKMLQKQGVFKFYYE